MYTQRTKTQSQTEKNVTSLRKTMIREDVQTCWKHLCFVFGMETDDGWGGDVAGQCLAAG